MQCPYCGSRMEPGRLEAHQSLNFLLRGDKSSRFQFSKQGIVLAMPTLFSRGIAQGYYCAPCGKIIFNVTPSTLTKSTSQ
jgi:DNA-directed RNA polymerase subunit RPC12/RpoP